MGYTQVPAEIILGIFAFIALIILLPIGLFFRRSYLKYKKSNNRKEKIWIGIRVTIVILAICFYSSILDGVTYIRHYIKDYSRLEECKKNFNEEPLCIRILNRFND